MTNEQATFSQVPDHDSVEVKRGSLQKKHCFESDLKPGMYSVSDTVGCLVNLVWCEGIIV